jgi:hypothetical protein
LPGFWLLNLIKDVPIDGYPNPVFFTATGMIGMIALSGLATRNAILLIEFVHEELREGSGLREALLKSGAVRFRPIFFDGGNSHAGRLADHVGPGLLRPGLVADLWLARFDRLHAGRRTSRLLADLRQPSRARVELMNVGQIRYQSIGDGD